MWITEAADVGLVTCKLKSEPLMALLNDNDNYDWNKLIKKTIFGFIKKQYLNISLNFFNSQVNH